MSAACYHLAVQEVSLGVFSQAEVEAGLATGRFAGTVLSWREGEARWVPLASRPEFGAARSAFATLQPATSPAFELGARAISRGFLGRLGRTWCGVFFRPSATFPPFQEGGRLGRAWLWLLLAATCAVPVLFLLGQSTLTAFFRAIGRGMEVRTDGLNLTYLARAMLLLPLWATGLAAMLTLALHAVLKVFAGGGAGWRTTFRVIAYLGGAWLFGLLALFVVVSPLLAYARPADGWLPLTILLVGLGFFVSLGRALALAHGDAGWKPGLALLAVLGLGCCAGCGFVWVALVPFFTNLGG